MSKQAYQFRLYPTKKQAQALQWTLDRARELYNAALSGLNKSILDAGWGQFQQFCRYKAARAGRSVLCVNPRYTSQVCSGCGTIKKKALDERWHSCECGTELDRDHNAALNILRLGRSYQEAQAS